MYGVLTGDVNLAREELGDVTHYVAEQVDGRTTEPIASAINSVACWGDTATVLAEPDRAAVAADGTRATPDAEGHHWGTVCPTDPEHREGVLDRIERVGEVGAVRLTTLGFPGAEFCQCERCQRLVDDSGHDGRDAWRTDVITDFVVEAAERVSGDLYATLRPDPYPGALQERAGLDPRALAASVDGFFVPLCGRGYETVYWVETLARGLGTELGDLDASLTVQLSADGVTTDRLVDVTRMVEPHADSVVYGTFPDDVETVRAVLRERRGDVARAGIA